MDVPAAVTAALMGIALIAVSTPFAMAALDEIKSAEKEFLVVWSQTDAASSDVTVTQSNGAVKEASITVTNPSKLTLAATGCADSANPDLQAVQPEATLTWVLVRKDGGPNGNTTEIGRGVFTCADGFQAQTFAAGPHPDIASVQAPNVPTAQLRLEKKSAALEHQNATFTLQLSATRPNPIQPLPQSTTLSGGLRLGAEAWSAAVVEREEEVK